MALALAYLKRKDVNMSNPFAIRVPGVFASRPETSNINKEGTNQPLMTSSMPRAEAIHRLSEISDGKVLQGPFHGLKLTNNYVWGDDDMAAKYFGVYEKSLWPAIDDIIEKQPSLIINIGCANGFYACGFAMRLPNAKVIAFDVLETANTAVSRNAEANGLNNIEYRHCFVTTDILNSVIRPGAVIIMDCEGGEVDLLNPGLVPLLDQCIILVETHEVLGNQTISPILYQRFHSTHEIIFIHENSIDTSVFDDIPSMKHLSESNRIEILSEHRPAPMSWLYLSKQHSESMRKTTSIPVVVVTSPNYSELFNVFKESLKLDTNKQLDLQVHNLNMKAYNQFGFHTDSWYYATTEKIRCLIQYMKDNTHRDIIICSDADISYMQPTHIIPVLVREFVNKNLDYYGMRENTTSLYNTGFFIIRNNERVRTFFRNVLRKIDGKKLDCQDQTAINDLIFKSDLLHDFIPSHYTVWGPYDQVRPTSIFHHAIGVSSGVGKLEQIVNVRRAYEQLKL